MTTQERQTTHPRPPIPGLEPSAPSVAPIIMGLSILLLVFGGTFASVEIPHSSSSQPHAPSDSSQTWTTPTKIHPDHGGTTTTSGKSPYAGLTDVAKSGPIAMAASIAMVRRDLLPAPDAFVRVCGTSLCANGEPYVMHGATAYGTYDDPAAEVALAQAAKLNTLEIVEFNTQYHVLADSTSEATWARVDRFIASAQSGGLHVVLNLSEYGQSLQAAGETPTKVDWHPYLSFIANRVNTVTGTQYKDDPTLAMVELFAEICYPGQVDPTCPAGRSGSAVDMKDFFHRSATQWSALAPNILVSSGGFSHLDSDTSIPWQAIVSDPANAVCSMELNSPNDVLNAADFTNYCKALGKPWFLSAWSSCYDKPSYPFHTPTDASMASHANDMYAIAKGNPPAAYPSIGTNFWNLRDEGAAGTCSIGPGFPLTWAAVRSNSP